MPELALPRQICRIVILADGNLRARLFRPFTAKKAAVTRGELNPRPT